MFANSVLLIGGSDEINGDYSRLRKMAARQARHTGGWSCTKGTRKGDELWFYVQAPQSAIVARGVALSDAKKGKNWPYEVRGGNIEWIRHAISLSELRQLFPHWRWTNNPRSKLHLEARIAVTLRRRLMSRSGFVENVISESGAGFGNAVQNRKVERAAVRHARRVYEGRGFHVDSCEAKKCGYDLIARFGRRELHIEVKGVAGARIQHH